MGSNDSNSKWFDSALKAFQERYPNVKAEYLSTNEYSTKKYVQLIEQAISTKPDGLVVAITDAAALDGVLRARSARAFRSLLSTHRTCANLPCEFRILALLERIIIRMGRGRANMLWRMPRPAKIQCPNRFSAPILTLPTAD